MLVEWELENPGVAYDRDLFRRDILRQLETVPLADIARAADCSKASASDIRQGKRTPQVSTWQVLATLIGVDDDRDATYCSPDGS